MVCAPNAALPAGFIIHYPRFAFGRGDGEAGVLRTAYCVLRVSCCCCVAAQEQEQILTAWC